MSAARPMPDDFIEVMHTMSKDNLALRYRTSRRVIDRWIAESGIEWRRKCRGLPRRPIPEGFAELAPHKLVTELCEIYGVSTTLIGRWLAEARVQAKVYERKGNADTLKKLQPVNLAPTRIKSIYDEAADVLRRERFLVNRCNERGGYDPKGKFWRVGWSTCTPDELLVRAVRYERAAA